MLQRQLKKKSLIVGDKIIEIDDRDISRLAQTYQKQLEEELPERQRWNGLIQKATTVLVKRDKDIFELILSNYEPEPYQATHSFKLLDDQTASMQLTDFSESEPIQEMIQKNQKSLEEIHI